MPVLPSGAFRSYDKTDIAVKDVKKRKQPINGLPVIRLINQAVELRRGGPESSDNLALRERTGADSLLGLDGELIEQRITKEARILVVFEDLLDMYGPLFPGFQNVGKPFSPQFAIDEDSSNSVVSGRLRADLGVGE